MDLADAHVYRLDIPLEGDFEIAGTRTDTIESVLVVLEDETGRRGLGTADPIPGHPIPKTSTQIYAGLTNDLAPVVAVDPPATANALRSRLDTVAGLENGKSALETAFLDLYCRQRGMSLAAFLGGALNDTEPLNAWIGLDDPERMVEEARLWHERGFRSLKMKIAGDPARDIERVRAVCEAVGETMQIRVDANEGYADVEEAIDVAKQLEDFDIEHLEQPVPRDDVAGLARITAATSLTVMADEPILTPGDGYRVLKADGADRLKFKLLKSGGVMPLRRGIDIAAAAGVDCIVGHGFCTAPTESAELQLVATQENVVRPPETVGGLKVRDDPFIRGVTIESAVATLPKTPGLGVGLEDDRLPGFVIESTAVI